MKSIHRITFSVGLILLVALGSIEAQQKDQPPADMKRNAVFGPDKLWTIHLMIGAKEYQAMTPKGGGFPFGAFLGKKDEPKKKEEPKDEPKLDVHKSKGFGMEFPWVKADIEFEKKLVKEIGIRYTGNSTYQQSSGGIKRPFKVDVNHYNDKLKVFGLGGFNLRNEIMDQTRIREALAYSLYRAAKVPAPRTAFVKVYLTVPEKHDRTYVGLYTLVEPVDKPFLAANFKNDNGMLLKPERIPGLIYLGEKWEAYADKYNPKREPTEAQKRRLIEFTKFVNQADDAKFKKDIEKFLDVDGFLRYAAVTSLTANLDSFLGLGHNYFMYLHPKTNQFHFIPWDLDLSFGGFGFAGDQLEWSIAQPYMGKNRLAERVLAIKDFDTAYRKHLRTLVEGAYSPKSIDASIAKLEATIKDAVAMEPKQKGGFGLPIGAALGLNKKDDLRVFAAKRADSVLAQLDGKSQGRVIAGLGFGGPKGGGFGIGNALVKPIFEHADANKDGKLSLDEFKTAAANFFKEAGGDERKPVAEAELIETINRLMPPPKGFGEFKPPPPPKGFGPGKGFAASILKQGGAGEDKKLFREQFLSGAEKLFQQWDKDKNRSLDEKELIEGINVFLPPAAFGPPPGFGPGDPTKKGPPKEKEK